MGKVLRFAVPAVIVFYLVYGIFFPHLPVVNPDELWETSRAYHLMTTHHPGEPILPKEVSPFYASIELMGWQGWFLGTAKSGSFALMMSILPADKLIAMRLTMFLWSVLVCVLTYLLARKFGLNAMYSLLAVSFLILFPDFFTQIHRERSEILITAALLAAVLLMMNAIDAPDQRSKNKYYFLAGLFSWLPSFLVHPSAIVVPGVIGVLYLVLEWKKIRSLQSVFIGVGLVLGCVFFLYLIHSMKEFAVAAGGGNYFNYQGPPILVRGLKYLPTIPLAFYKKFTSINVFSRPLCFFIFTSGILLLIASRKAHREYFKKQHSTILLIVLFTSLTLLYLLSGSFGNYNVVVAPFIMIIFTIIISKIIFYNGNKKAATLLASFLLFSCFIVDAINIPKDIRFAKEYNEMLVTAKENISLKSGEGVMALALYYEPFKDQNFYSNSWFNQYAGIPGQSFEHAVKELNVKYVILDDAFVGRAILDRGIHWTDSMMTFLADSGQVVNEKNVKYFVGNRVPAPTRYPKYWQYDGQAASYIKKMKIIKIKTAE